jgi:sec-independent protein translocase protein TatA
MMKQFRIIALLASIISVSAFVSPSRSVFGAPTTTLAKPSTIFTKNAFLPTSIQHQRKSVANVQTMSLFGLGAPELAIILVAALLVLGPEKITEVVRQSGKVAGELKDELKEVPAEFKKGLEEGEGNVRSKTAKVMDSVPDEKESNKD